MNTVYWNSLPKKVDNLSGRSADNHYKSNGQGKIDVGLLYPPQRAY